ncbi:MAG TPA: methyltransferase dimerization domain-containing protein [Anaerolineae bacterium]|nr:methyltransferase dimerization domain-containing protein [Anaerolineae bacterium]HPL30405.1 methyltransferase dimerization domain-containing protein [Anaerolineae bacterium]
MTNREDEQTVLQQRQQLRELTCGCRVSSISFTCVELGAFEAIAAGVDDATEIARAVQADRRGVELLLNAACAVGLLDKRENRCPNTPPLRAIDAGGGHGGYSLALARRYPLLTACAPDRGCSPFAWASLT